MIVPLIHTEGPHGKMASCGFAIPGQWLTLQQKLRDVVVNAAAVGMQVNDKKTKLLVINPNPTKQAVPMIAAVDGSPLLCVPEIRLLGLVFDERLTWWPLVSDLVRRTRSKIWALHRLREAGASVDILLVNYCTRIRSVLEYGCAVWGCMVSGIQAKTIEDVQRSAVQVVLGSEASGYEANLVRLELEEFAIKLFKDPKFRYWYKPSPPQLV